VGWPKEKNAGQYIDNFQPPQRGQKGKARRRAGLGGAGGGVWGGLKFVFPRISSADRFVIGFTGGIGRGGAEIWGGLTVGNCGSWRGALGMGCSRSRAE